MFPRAILFLFLLSGATGLVYEVVWTRLLVLLFGSSVLGISSIVTAFLGGLALGSLWFGQRADRIGRPLRVYGFLEIAIGVYAAMLPFVFERLLPAVRALWSISGENYETFSLLRFALAAGLLLFPTFLMGASLPLLGSLVARSAKGSSAARIGDLYGWNTLGAVLGTLAAGFFLMPWLGVRGASWVCALGNVAAGVWALALDRRWPMLSAAESERSSSHEPRSREDLFVLASMGCAGFAALALEVCWSRLLGTIYGSSLHGFCITLSAFLAGIALGSLWISKRLRKREAGFATLAFCELGIAASALLGFFFVREIVFWNFLFQDWLHDNPVAWLVLRYAMSSLIVLVPTFLMGAAFPLAIGLLRASSRPGETAGRVYGWNTLGAILGSFSAGFFLLPWLGLEKTMLLSCALLAVLALALFLRGESKRGPVPFRRRLAFSGLGVLAIGMAIWRPEWNPGTISAGGIYFRNREKAPKTRAAFFDLYEGESSGKKPLFYRDGRNASVGVYEGRNEIVYLEVNGKVDASSSRGDMPTQLLSGLLPLLAPERPQSALVIGCGSGVTLGALAQDPDLYRLDLVELERAVIEGARFFDKVNFHVLADPRVRVIENDGRNHLLLREEPYDLIVSEPSNPWMSGAANLFTKEFFRLAREKLTERGIFAQWLQLYAIQPEELKVLARTLLSEFPESIVFKLNEVDLVFVCWKQGPPRLELARLFRAFEHPVLGPALREILPVPGTEASGDPAAVLGLFRLDPRMARLFAGEGPLNTDDNLRIESRTPFSLFDSTHARNREEIERFPASLKPYLLFPKDPGEAAAYARALAEGFRRRGQHRLAEELGG